MQPLCLCTNKLASPQYDPLPSPPVASVSCRGDEGKVVLEKSISGRKNLKTIKIQFPKLFIWTK